ncbi:MAG: hypothetical protein M1553_04855, partial [Firmicutes bacterium]|nr:hypothetical protein [Bacillota bacterium]
MSSLFYLAAAAAKAPKPEDFTPKFFQPGMMWDAIFVVLLFVAIGVMIQRARAGLPIPAIRKLAGLDAIDEAIGRATEMGRPVHFSP